MKLRLTKPAVEPLDQPNNQPPDAAETLAKIYTVLRNHPEVLAAVEQALRSC